jgi:hypothetical protein
MALNPLFIISSDIEQYYVDKDSGLPLANGLVYYYRDIARNVPKTVYQLTGAPPDYTYTALPNPIQLSAVGTIQNAGGDNEVTYYYPWITDPATGDLVLDLYYIVVTDANGTVQFTREGWPNITSANSPIEEGFYSVNQISNPTFTNTFLNPGIANVYNVTAATNQVVDFAPDWQFVISGTGMVTVQIFPIQGNNQIPSSPPYVLDVIVGTGITSCLLRQRFPANSGLWTSTTDSPIFLSGSFIGENQNGGTTGVQMFFDESSGVNAFPGILIVNGTFGTEYSVASGSTAAIPASTNTDSGTSGYVEIYLSFTLGSHVRISAIQVIPTKTNPIAVMLPDFDSSNRNEAYQGDYYLPRCASKQINSYLVGWDFPVNPFQFGPVQTITTTPAYIADQTIAASATSNIAVAKDATTHGLSLTTSGTNDAFYILQYLNGDQVLDMIGGRLAVNVFGYQLDTIPNNPITMQIYLFSGGSTATIPTLPTTIGTIAPTTGIFTLTAANWVSINRNGLPIPQVTLNATTYANGISYQSNDYGFSGWELTDPTQIAATDLFAIVVTFKYIAPSTILIVNSISVVPGDLPCRPNIQSFDQTLSQCQYYYSKSFLSSGAPIQGAGPAASGVQTVAASLPGVGPIVQFPTYMRTQPMITLYNPAAGNNQIRNNSIPADWSGSSVALISPRGFTTFGTTPAASSIGQSTIVSWSADARLGIV